MIKDYEGNIIRPGDLVMRPSGSAVAVVIEADMDSGCFHTVMNEPTSFLLKIMHFGRSRPTYVFSDRVKKI